MNLLNYHDAHDLVNHQRTVWSERHPCRAVERTCRRAGAPDERAAGRVCSLNRTSPASWNWKTDTARPRSTTCSMINAAPRQCIQQFVDTGIRARQRRDPRMLDHRQGIVALFWFAAENLDHSRPLTAQTFDVVDAGNPALAPAASSLNLSQGQFNWAAAPTRDNNDGH